MLSGSIDSSEIEAINKISINIMKKNKVEKKEE